MFRKRFTLTLTLAALAVVAAPVFAAGQAVESTWQAGPMTIDGGVQEWDSSTPIIDEDSKAEYAFRNDGKNLYIIMVFRDPDPRTRAAVYPKSTLDYTGMKIFFTNGPKKSKDYGILFQKKQYTADALIASLQKRGQKLSEAQIAEIRKKPTHIVFTEEVIKPKKAVAPAEEAGLAEPPMFRSVDAERGRISICEFRIPLNRISQIGGINAGPGQQVLLGFEWGGMTSQILKDMMAGRADGSVSASDRGVQSDAGFRDPEEGGGGFGRQGSEVGEMGRNPRYAKHAFWIEAKLAGEAK
jgi:hypothetical protein